MTGKGLAIASRATIGLITICLILLASGANAAAAITAAASTPRLVPSAGQPKLALSPQEPNPAAQLRQHAQTMSGPYALSQISCPDAAHCISVGSSGMAYITTNAGQSWSAVATGTPGLLFGIDCISDARCWAVGENGVIVTTSNWGLSWTSEISGTTQILYSVSCPSTNDCWVGGDNGTILATSSGGTIWAPQNSGTTNSYFSMSCPSTVVCLAGSNSYNVTDTTDGGASWNQAPGNLVEGFFGVSCSTTTQCWAVGSGGAIISSSDSGQTWSTQQPGSTDMYQQAFWSVTCPSSSVCLSVGANDSLARTTNGGLNWSTTELPFSDLYLGISCPNTSDCFASGGSGHILASTDGGVTWTSAMTPAVSSASPTSLLVVGDSMANTMGIGLAAQQDWYGLSITNEGILGCGVTEGSPVTLDGNSTQVAGECSGQLSLGNPQLEQKWETDIQTFDPQTVLLVAGRWEVVDRQFNGTMMNITQVPYQGYVLSQLRKAVEILTSRGAHLLLATSPYFNEPGPPGGGIYDQDQPARVDEYNALVRQIAAQFPGRVSVADLNAEVDPSGQFATSIDGVEVRSPDGVHFSIPGGEWLASWILPMAAAATPPSLTPPEGYWTNGSDGSVYSFGTAKYFGSMQGKTISNPVVAMSATADNGGYWEVASDGGIFAFGDAGF
ncbi:MAG TPA: YCF48-related protein, partial [Acidimicrobiales bacterium]|nr:YCF48-related protein [Acidimicrobiales bacterium]